MSMQWGCPWHGPVEAGQLTLPSGATLTWPQPAGDTKDDAGFTLLAKMPDVQPVERTAEEQAADSAAGMQWLDRAIIAGAGRQEPWDAGGYLHGRPVGGWIYAAPDGSRWRVGGLGRRRMYSANLSLSLTLRRFGVLGGQARSYGVSASITAAQQGQASWSSSSYDTPEKYRYNQVQDVTPTGDRAIIMVYVARDKALPLGFVLLTLTGTPGVDLTATLSKLAGLAEIETDREVINAALPLYKSYASYTTEVISSDPIAPLYARNYGGAAWMPDGSALPASAERFHSGIPVGNGEARAAVTRMVGMWFDPAGQPQPVRLGIERSVVMSYPMPSAEVSGRRVASGTGDVNISIYEYPEVNLTREVSRTAITRYRLQFGEQSVELLCSESASISFKSHLEGGPAPKPSTRAPGSFELQEASVSRTAGGLEDRWSDVVGFSRGLEPTYFYASEATPRGEWVATINAAVAAYSYARPAEIHVGLRRFASNLFGLQVFRVPGGGQGVMIASQAPMTPAGPIHGAALASQAGAGRLDELLPYGSWNPITGEVAICRAEPVSWT